jgi:hypothetical protein
MNEARMQSQFATTIIGLVLLTGYPVDANSPVRPAKAEYFPGTYEGYGDDRRAFLRMDLAVDGTGYLVLSYAPDYPTRIYRIERWRQVRDGAWTLALTIKPATKESEIITIEDVYFGFDSFTLETRGKTWKQQFSLFKKGAFEARAAAAETDLKKSFK